MALFLRQRWKRQPNGLVGVDWSNTLSTGLVYLPAYAAGGGDAAQRIAERPPLTPGAAFASTRYGTGIGIYGGANDRAQFTRSGVASFSPLPEGTAPFTMEVLLSMTATISLGNVFYYGPNEMPSVGTTGLNHGLLSFGGASPYNIYFWGGGSGDLDSGVLWRTDGSLQHVFVTYNGASATIYRDGKQIKAPTPITLLTGGANPVSVCVGSRYNSGSNSNTFCLYKAAVYNRQLSAPEVAELTNNPWQQFAPLRRALYFGATSGSATHTTSGTLTGPGATVAGTAAHLTLHTTTGTLTGAGSTVAGTAAHQHATTGALTGPGSTVAGTAAHQTLHATTGTLTGAGSSVAGTAAHQHATTGALTGAGATVAGTAVHQALHATSGTLTGAGSTVAGTAERSTTGTHATTGDLVGAGSTVAGTAARLAIHATTGALTGPGASISGTAQRLALHTTSGIIVGAGAVVAGAAVRGLIGVHPADGALIGVGALIAGTAKHSPPAVFQSDPRAFASGGLGPARVGVDSAVAGTVRLGVDAPPALGEKLD